MNKHKPVVLIILDGWGVAPAGEGNAITQAKLPNFNHFVTTYPAMTLSASGNEVGLEWGQMGNSEVGHANIGAGRVCYQTLSRINKSISDGSFFENKTLVRACEHATKHKSVLHLMGLVSNGNVHSSEEHLYALLNLAQRQKVKDVLIHVFLDGRDALFNGGLESVKKLQAKIKELKIGKIVSIAGRFYAMDRDNRWDRTQKAYEAIALGQSALTFNDPLKAIQASYDKKIYDEEFVPTVIVNKGEEPRKIGKKDAIIFFNFRPDRARQLTKAFVLPGFEKFSRQYSSDLFFATMTEFEKDLPVEVAFAPQVIKNCLAEAVSAAGLKQFHAAETEKYAHITFFLNGMIEKEFSGEERQIVPSPQVATYDQQPEMSAVEITKAVLKAVESGKYDFIAMNLANADMVAHSGLMKPTVKGIEVIDKCLGQIADLVLAKDGAVVITADHGNAEELINLQTNEMDKEHSTNPVPMLVIARELEGQKGSGGDALGGDLSLIPPVGLISDVAPTVLKLLGVEQPKEMTARTLI
ncbi:MAG: 2,3-bisphosphoglycerate-independent phosphoglycerate mutase [Candidatus Magasanikbacteria bacterium]|nr:2,3-bisphosphoglycerate-independent phosphoglycerate mutase [Candidatus Magasanikbacteria bacterium]